jgi:hypothetical protein
VSENEQLKSKIEYLENLIDKLIGKQNDR